MEYRDYYATLGLPRTASQADIKKAFRRLARKHHPDVNTGNAEAEQRFKEISEANEVLSDPQKRRAYDAMGRDWAAWQRAGATGAHGAGASAGGFAGFPGGVRFEFRGDPQDLAGFSDFFRTFFAGEAAAAGPGGSGRGAGRAAGARTRTRAGGGAGLDLDELLRGMAGSGLDRSGMPGSAAGGGGGAGRAVRRRPEAGADVEVSLEEVHGGAERVVQVDGRRLEVRIPPGVRDGQRIRLSGRAGADGDVYLTIRVRPHPVFTRQGDDLSRELPLSLAEMLLGAQVPLGTIGGRSVLLTIPPGTQNGQAIRLAGQGLPRFRAEGRGDLLVRARVVLPTTLDEEGRHLARALADHVKQPDPRGSHRAPPT